MTENKYNYSLIIPHYNIPDLLERLLKTVPERDDLQVIVVDDCSPAEAQDKLSDVKQKFPKVEFYSTGTNGGGGKARNVGLEHALGKYLIFADADDYFLPNFSNFLEENKDLDLDVLYFGAIFEHEEDNSRLTDNYINKFLREGLKKGKGEGLKFLFTQPWCKLINREVVTLNGIKFEESIISNDVRFSTGVDLCSKLVNADLKPFYVWRIRKKSTSRGLNAEKILKRLEIDLNRHTILKQNKRKDRLHYLAMLDLAKESKNKDLINRALTICQNNGISRKEIILTEFKSLIRKLIR